MKVRIINKWIISPILFKVREKNVQFKRHAVHVSIGKIPLVRPEILQNYMVLPRKSRTREVIWRDIDMMDYQHFLERLPMIY
jgi:hypothetical protein